MSARKKKVYTYGVYFGTETWNFTHTTLMWQTVNMWRWSRDATKVDNRRQGLISTGHKQSSCLHRASTVSRYFFITPNWCTQLRNHKNIETIKIPTIAPPCFGSPRNHHQGAISCLAKTTNMILCARLYWRDQCHGCIPVCCSSALYTLEF